MITRTPRPAKNSLQSWLELLDAGATCAQISLGGLAPPFPTELWLELGRICGDCRRATGRRGQGQDRRRARGELFYVGSLRRGPQRWAYGHHSGEEIGSAADSLRRAAA